MMYAGYFIIGAFALVIIGYLLQYLSTFIGDRKVNIILAIVSLMSALVCSVVMYIMIRDEMFIYNSIDISIVTYIIINLLSIYICLYACYKLISLKDTPSSRWIYTAPIVVLFIYGSFLANSFSEIDSDKYKKLASYSKELSSNSEVKALYDEYFPKYSSDNIITSREFNKLRKINNYKYYLKENQIRSNHSDTEEMTKKKYLDEAKENLKSK